MSEVLTVEAIRKAIDILDKQPVYQRPFYFTANQEHYEWACRMNALSGNCVDVIPPAEYQDAPMEDGDDAPASDEVISAMKADFAQMSLCYYGLVFPDESRD